MVALGAVQAFSLVPSKVISNDQKSIMSADSAYKNTVQRGTSGQNSAFLIEKSLSWMKVEKSLFVDSDEVLFSSRQTFLSFFQSNMENTKIFPENWDSRAPSVRTLLACLETTA